MTAVSAPAVPAPAVSGAAGRAVARHAPPHLAMLGVMVAVMLPGSDAMRHLAGALVLLVVGVVVAPAARRRQELVAVLLDLTAMGAVLVALALAASPDSAAPHAHGGAVAPLLAAICAGWMLARIVARGGRVATLTGVLCGAQLALMSGPALI